MKKFLVLYKAPVEEFTKAMQSMTPEDQEASKKEWWEWMEKHKADLADMGAPIGKTKEVSASGVADIRNDIGGYGIVQAESHEAAAELLKDSPHLARMQGTVEVMELMEM